MLNKQKLQNFSLLQHYAYSDLAIYLLSRFTFRSRFESYSDPETSPRFDASRPRALTGFCLTVGRPLGQDQYREGPDQG